MTFTFFTHILELLALFSLFSFLLAVAVGTCLEDHSACDEPFEQCCHVRLIREDEHV